MKYLQGRSRSPTAKNPIRRDGRPRKPRKRVTPLDRPDEDFQAADAFRKTLFPRADGELYGSPVFYGWAIMESFLAGINLGRGKK